MNKKERKSNLYLIKRVFKVISIKRKFQIILLCLLLIICGILEMISIASTIPFISLLTNPDRLANITLLSKILEFFNISGANNIKIFITFSFILFIIFSTLLRVFNVWVSSRFSAKIGSDISKNILVNTISIPYEQIISINSSSKITTLTTYLEQTIYVINMLLVTLSSIILIFSIILSLYLISGNLVFLLILSIGGFYLILMRLLINRIRSNSRNKAYLEVKKVKFIQELFGSIRDIILDSLQYLVIKKYSKIEFPIRKIYAELWFMNFFPKYLIESFAIITLIISALILNENERFAGIGVIPLIGAIAVGAQKILPLSQQLYSSWSLISGNYSGVDQLLRILEYKNVPNYSNPNVLPKLIFKNNLKLENIEFSYGDKKILNNINLSIKAGEKIGIKGETGSGKSTLLDIIMGLLKPTKGRIIVDNNDITNNRNKGIISAWQKNIAHVPQDIYLSDNSILENIVFGFDEQSINFDNVIEVSKKAQILDFINTLPQKFETFIGEKGVKLSGGQLQRIGIARALYKKSKLIIFDEATSALDNKTETNVINEIQNFDEEITVIMVAHRLSTLDKCDRIIEIINGKII